MLDLVVIHLYLYLNRDLAVTIGYSNNTLILKDNKIAIISDSFVASSKTVKISDL